VQHIFTDLYIRGGKEAISHAPRGAGLCSGTHGW
jgi:hypothetical protein